MSREGAYMVFCLERYRHARHMSGAEAAKFFAEHGLYEYVMRFFGAFHTMAEELVFDEIDRHAALAAACGVPDMMKEKGYTAKPKKK